MSSLIDCFEDLSAAVGVVTETWLSDGPTLEQEVDNLVLGTGLQMLYRNRECNERGFSHGGVAIVFKETMMDLRVVRLYNPGKAEMLLATGCVKGCLKKIEVLACYLPPNYTVPKARAAMDFVASAVSHAKDKLDDPLLIVAGNFNQWKICLLYTSPSPRD